MTSCSQLILRPPRLGLGIKVRSQGGFIYRVFKFHFADAQPGNPQFAQASAASQAGSRKSRSRANKASCAMLPVWTTSSTNTTANRSSTRSIIVVLLTAIITNRIAWNSSHRFKPLRFIYISYRFTAKPHKGHPRLIYKNPLVAQPQI